MYNPSDPLCSYVISRKHLSTFSEHEVVLVKFPLSDLMVDHFLCRKKAGRDKDCLFNWSLFAIETKKNTKRGCWIQKFIVKYTPSPWSVQCGVVKTHLVFVQKRLKMSRFPLFMTSYDVTQNLMTLHGVKKIGRFESAILAFSIFQTSEANCWKSAKSKL